MVAGRPSKFETPHSVSTKIEEEEYELLKQHGIPATVALTWGVFELVEMRMLSNKTLTDPDIKDFYRVKCRAMQRIRDVLFQHEISRLEQTTLAAAPESPEGIPGESMIRVWNAFDYQPGEIEYIPRAKYDPSKHKLQITGKDLIHVWDTVTDSCVQVTGVQYLENPVRYDIRLVRGTGD